MTLATWALDKLKGWPLCSWAERPRDIHDTKRINIRRFTPVGAISEIPAVNRNG
jgi:hypothetical protein